MDIDLDSDDPGKMYGGADNAKQYTFMLMKYKPEITPRLLEGNPNAVTGDDLFFKSPIMPDEKSRAMVDLKAHKDSIKGKLKDAKTSAIAAVIAESKADNENPNLKIAVFQPVTLHKLPQELKLNPIKVSVSQADWITYHHSILFVELVAKDIPQITWEVSPKTDWFNSPCMLTGIWEQGNPGSKEFGGKLLLGSVGQGCGNNPKCGLPAGNHDGKWWDVWATQIDTKFAPQTLSLTPGRSNYVIGLYPRFPGSYTLTVTGTGSFKDLKATINLSSQGTPSGD